MRMEPPAFCPINRRAASAAIHTFREVSPFTFVSYLTFIFFLYLAQLFSRQTIILRLSPELSETADHLGRSLAL